MVAFPEWFFAGGKLGAACSPTHPACMTVSPQAQKIVARSDSSGKTVVIEAGPPCANNIRHAAHGCGAATREFFRRTGTLTTLDGIRTGMSRLSRVVPTLVCGRGTRGDSFSV